MFSIALNFTRYGNHLQAVGRDPITSLSLGISPARIKLIAFLICAVLASFAAMLDLVDSKCLRFCYDNGHEMLYNGSMDLLKKYSHRLAVIHFHDNDGQKDLHLVPFDGKLDLPAFASQLNKLERIPDITMECEMAYSHFGQTESFLKAAYEAGKRFMGMLKH